MKLTKLIYMSVLLCAAIGGAGFANAKDKQKTCKSGCVTDTAFVKEKMQQVCSWQLANPVELNAKQEQWARSAFYTGQMYAFRHTGDSTYLRNTLKWGEGWDWKRGHRYRHADDLACGQAYLDAYDATGDAKMLKPIRASVDSLIADPVRGRKDWWWCDALFMEPPVLARLARITGDKVYLDYMQDKYADAVNYLYCRQDSLFYRDKRFFSTRTKNGHKVFWGRGNAWVIAGLAQVLDIVPPTHPSYEYYKDLYTEMCEKLIKLQQPDGLWRASLLDPDEVPVKETSSSGYIAYALAWGVNSGLLPADVYKPSVKKAWHAILECVDRDGKLGYVQPIGASPETVLPSDNQEYGSGAFLMLASEILKL